ncbi:UDP-N-acetylglucosamine 2-epimerase (hydrolyzing) [Clostridium sp. YIM B02515]|uniref:UDP-N-acetylglucosamine 2-epimerase (Hydrolyzing) n=1 Tax=Clostridium rhizosphaerae TaxID=2803861 RepID=A0ABS1TFI8_9CLOT|nr:UDP-N-acetylglucosamine 2-epimerase [Clostridium rhizosphaerae]MBL4938139.1 UDP-N-acetylglucosamine 2-epimerase (hydrolyzing) [Clostridium rhizosphaerae]
MRKIAVVTGTRAEYGLLKNIIRRIKEDTELELQLIVTGTHLSTEYGYTVEEIRKDSFEISDEIDILMESNNKQAISKAMGIAMLGLSQTFSRLKPDLLLILGDRYEIFAATSVAMAMNIPIAHISGGEITEGAMDEQIRHSITKMAHIHFPGAEAYADNIIRMGEESWRVFNVGDPGIENVKNTKFLSQEELKEDLGIEIDKDTLLVTFHPVTLEIDQLHYQVENLLKALKETDRKLLITFPNSDNGGKYIINELKKFQATSHKVHLYENLGVRRYLSVLRLCGAVVGNSSSAIVEAPLLKVPVINIGNRQKGRLMANNIIQSSYSSDEIIRSIRLALSDEFIARTRNVKSLYGEGNTSKDIVDILKKINIDEKLMKKRLIWR